MFDWIDKLFNISCPKLDELDRKIAAADARIAAKQAYLEQLKTEEPDYPLPICCPACKSDEDWADTEKGYCRYCEYYLP